MAKHTVPKHISPCGAQSHLPPQKYGGLTLRGVIQSVASDNNFNGHFCLWFLDNDNNFIVGNSSADQAVCKYKDILSKLFQGIHLERLYLTTAPFRKSDFDYDPQFRCCVKDFKVAFNSQLRKIFGEDNAKINDFPVTLIDLNVCLPENKMYNPKFYCKNERNKVHFNAIYYRKYLEQLFSILEIHGGLSNHSDNLAANPSVCKELQQTLPPSLHLDHTIPIPRSSPQHSEQVMTVRSPISEGISASSQTQDDSPLSQPSISRGLSLDEVSLDVPETTTDDDAGKPKKRRGKHNKNRSFDPFRMLRINFFPMD